MKPRTIQTIKLLAVAVTASGCTRTEIGAEPAEPTVATAQAAGTPAPSANPAPPGAVAQPAEEERPIPPLPPSPEGAKLVALAQELDQAGPEGAAREVARFRPLCDKDGYPLVGNVMGKGQRGRPYTAARFCAEVRRKATS
jgi:hypothetical protein